MVRDPAISPPMTAMLADSFEEIQRWKADGVLLLACSSDADILHGEYSAAPKRIKGM